MKITNTRGYQKIVRYASPAIVTATKPVTAGRSYDYRLIYVVVRDILIVFLALVPENRGQKKRLRIFREKSQNYILFYLISWQYQKLIGSIYRYSNYYLEEGRINLVYSWVFPQFFSSIELSQTKYI